MRKMNASRSMSLLACLAAIGLPASPAAGADEDKWQFEFTPYLFGASLKGTTGVKGAEANVDMSFNDIWNNLDKAFMGVFEIRKGKWGFIADGLYVKLTDEGTRNSNIASTTVNASMTEQIYQPTLAYRFGDDRAFKWDLLAAGRYTKLDATIDAGITIPGPPFSGGRSVDESKSWWDPVVGARAIIPFLEHWSVVAYGDVGIGSRTTYQFLGGVNWQFSETFSAKAGYRYLKQDYESGGFKWDMKMQGFYAGLGILF